MVARAVVARLRRLTDVTPFEQHLARLESYEKPAEPITKLQRTPFFCSGCPHNTSTRVPEGSRAMAGIGCHSMALFMPGGKTATTTQMAAKASTGSARRRSHPSSTFFKISATAPMRIPA